MCRRTSMHAKSSQSCPTLCNPIDCSLTGSSVHGIHQARILEWVAIPFSRGSSQRRDQTCVPYVSRIGRRILYVLFTPSATWTASTNAASFSSSSRRAAFYFPLMLPTQAGTPARWRQMPHVVPEFCGKAFSLSQPLPVRHGVH